MGQPIRGCLIVIEGELKDKADGRLDFMFNPTQYGVSKRNNWSAKPNKSSNVPQYDFAGGGARELQLELFFDSYLPRPDVKVKDLRLLANKLFNFMMIDPGSLMKGKNSQMSQPPKCRLMWGEDIPNQFDCYITSCQVKFTLFNEQGVPIRATASLSLTEARDSEDRLPTNPTSRGDPGRHMRTVEEGDRLDWIAYQEYGNPNEWRRIAEANRLFNPLDIYPGMVLAIPPF